LLLLLAACGGAHAGVRTALVVEVIDGDTVVIDFDGREELVRLIGIDTPETVHPDRPVECFGPEASAFAAGLLPPGSEVEVTRDVVDRDDYGRLLGYVHRSDGLFVNEELVRRGFAVPLRIEPNVTYSRAFVAAAQAAEAEDLGLWVACRE
jgi:micrococcal nuclease